MPHDKLTKPPAAAADPEALRQMACVFAEEFARMGYEGPKILRMFQNPFYAGAYNTYRVLGHAATAAVIEQCLAKGRTRLFEQPAAARSSTFQPRPGARR